MKDLMSFTKKKTKKTRIYPMNLDGLLSIYRKY